MVWEEELPYLLVSGGEAKEYQSLEAVAEEVVDTEEAQGGLLIDASEAVTNLSITLIKNRNSTTEHIH